MINEHQHNLIGSVMKMLNEMPDDAFEKADMHINIQLKTTAGYMTVDFSDEFGEWTYEVTTI